MPEHQPVLITGGNGNLGRLVAERLLSRNYPVIKFDLPGTEPGHTSAGETVITGDIRDSGLLKQIIGDTRPSRIYHLASLLSGSSETNPLDAWEINASASFNLLKLAGDQGIDRFFFASTIATYGAVDSDPMPADHPQWPDNLYGATKVAVERLGVYFKLNHGLDFRCARYPMVVSPYAPKTAVTAYPSHALRAAFNGESFTFPVSEHTSMSTMFLDDVVASIVDIMEVDRSALTQHVYGLHAYTPPAGQVASAAREKFPGFEFSFDPLVSVEHLISSWPDALDDSSARKDWHWNPLYDFFASAQKMFRLLEQEI